jgi:predicted nucleic acid-binding protein
MTLIDTNVLLDITTSSSEWGEWSLEKLDSAAIIGPLLINDIIYAEFSVGYTTIAAVETFLTGTGIKLATIPRAALFLAGKAFRRYRAAGGVRRGVLPDFFIGAHAAVGGLTLLTRDAQRYRSYFPTIELVTP